MSIYKSNRWKEFRANVIELDGNKCSRCGKSKAETVLQVHHKIYIYGRRPWEYATNDCETLCKGCHATEHGKIMPKFGWEYIGYQDLGDLCGICENCNNALRHAFYVYHENWGIIEVGEYCCDALTDSVIASNQMESQKRFESRKERFLRSKRWIFEKDVYKIRQNIFDIEITKINSNFMINVSNISTMKSKKFYNSLEEAKSIIFDAIELGKLFDYMKKHNIQIP